MAGKAGPAGSGLIPPASGSRKDDDTDLDRDQDESSEDEDIDGVPPVEDEDDGDDDLDEDDGDGIDLDEVERRIEQRLEQKFQRRFDKAVSKARRNLERQYESRQSTRDEDDDDDDDDEAGSPPPRKRRQVQRRSRNVDVTSIRILARDMVSDQMTGTGSQERKVVKSVLDAVLPMVDWSLADEEDFVADLVERLSTASVELVKTGSDRKVAQLRRMGALPERKGQPSGQASSGGRGTLEKAMRKGAAAAQERFPDGKRRLLR